MRITAIALSLLVISRVAFGGTASPCPADIAPVGGSGGVDIDDLLAIISGWGPCTGACAPCTSDVNCSAVTDIDDVLAVLGAWGPCATPLVWSYTVNLPAPPEPPVQTIVLDTLVTVALIQQNIGSDRLIVVKGSVTGVNTPLLIGGVNDLTLDFSDAILDTWSGAFTTSKFLEITGDSSRIRLVGLNFNGNTGQVGGLRIFNASVPITDISIEACTFDGTSFGADVANVNRIRFLNCEFTDSIAPAGDDNGYGIYLAGVEDVEINGCLLTTASSVPLNLISDNPYALRAGFPVRMRVVNTTMHGGGDKRSAWVYGANQVEFRGCTFQRRRVLIGLSCNEPFEGMTEAVRVDSCVVRDIDGCEPQIKGGPSEESTEGVFIVYCSHITRDVRIRNVDFVNVRRVSYLMSVGWRDGLVTCNDVSGNGSRDINWFAPSIRKSADGLSFCVVAPGDIHISDDWSCEDIVTQNIGPPCSGATCGSGFFCVKNACFGTAGACDAGEGSYNCAEPPPATCP